MHRLLFLQSQAAWGQTTPYAMPWHNLPPLVAWRFVRLNLGLCTDNAVMIAHLAAERLALEAQTNIHPIKTQEQTFEQEEQAPVRPRWPLVP